MDEILLLGQICILPGPGLQLRLLQAMLHAALREHQGCVPLFLFIAPDAYYSPFCCRNFLVEIKLFFISHDSKSIHKYPRVSRVSISRNNASVPVVDSLDCKLSALLSSVRSNPEHLSLACSCFHQCPKHSMKAEHRQHLASSGSNMLQCFILFNVLFKTL